MPQIAQQDYFIISDPLPNSLVTGGASFKIRYGLIRAYNRGIIFDVLVKDADSTRRVVSTGGTEAPNGVGVALGGMNSAIAIDYPEATYKTLAELEEKLNVPFFSLMPDDDGFLKAYRTNEIDVYISSCGYLVNVTADDDDNIASLTVSDTPVGEKENVELAQEELQTLVGYLLY